MNYSTACQTSPGLPEVFVVKIHKKSGKAPIGCETTEPNHGSLCLLVLLTVTILSGFTRALPVATSSELTQEIVFSLCIIMYLIKMNQVQSRTAPIKSSQVTRMKNLKEKKNLK